MVELNNGMIQFNEEGISQITSLVGSDADDAIDTIKKVINLGKDYSPLQERQMTWTVL